MSFSSLPAELVDCVLSYVVPSDWSIYSDRGNGEIDYGNADDCHDWCPRGRDILVLRLVCRQFHATISRELLRKANSTELLNDMARMNVDGLTAVLLAKMLLGEKHRIMPFRHAATSADALCKWKATQNEYLVEALCFRAACSTMLANKGPGWAHGEIERQDSGTDADGPVPPMLAVDERGDPKDPILQLLEGGCFPIAAFLGDLSVIEALLGHGADPNKPHALYGYPLYAAACAGQLDAVRLLLDAGADVSLSTGAFGSPLEAAARHGHLEVAQFLVENNAAIGVALSDALFGGHEAVAAFLLSQADIDVNASRNCGFYGSPIWLATRYGYRDIALQLCSHADLETNRPGPDRKGSLYLAVAREWTDVVEALLTFPATNANASYGLWRGWRTPLQLACYKGYEDGVRLLLARDDIDVDIEDIKNDTLLSIAIMEKHTSIALLLLEHPGTEANCVAGRGHVPLEMALLNGSSEVFDALLKRPEVLADAFNGERALSVAISVNDLPTMRRLLDLFSPDLNKVDDSEIENLVHWAIGKYRPSAVELLLSMGNVDPNLRCGGITLLCAAARRASLETVQLLLSQDGVDVNALGRNVTPLYYATRKVGRSRMEIVRCLLARPDLDVNLTIPQKPTWLMVLKRESADFPSERPFSMYSWVDDDTYDSSDRIPTTTRALLVALRFSSAEVVELLLKHPAIDPNVTGRRHRTSLVEAVLRPVDPAYYEYGTDFAMTRAQSVRMVSALLSHPATDPNIADCDGWTPLLLAVQENIPELVHVLLKHPGTDPNQPNPDGWTPLLLAVGYDRADIVALLLKHPRIDVCMAPNEGLTPLELAVELGRDRTRAILEAAHQR